MTKHLVIMVKEPHPGRVKTRLGRDIGMTTAAWWFRHQTRRLIRRLQDPRWTLTLAVAPDFEGMQSRVWDRRVARIPQGPGNLGDRMGRVFQGMPPGPVCIIGADIPGVTPALIHDAFRVLGGHDAVFGPAPDGGYWLVGLKRNTTHPRGLFENVRWSTQHALSDTLVTLSGKRVGYIQPLQDVDTVKDLRLIP
ncbi:MAG: TIGR04282 family arsenosugar biosynthesis glycosyltransferase [Pseudomonadota bacterium]